MGWQNVEVIRRVEERILINENEKQDRALSKEEQGEEREYNN